MKTIIPPTIEKTMPKTSGVNTGWSAAKPMMPPDKRTGEQAAMSAVDC